MTMNPIELLDRLEEVSVQTGELSVANIMYAHVAYPERYPDYATVHKVFGGIKQVKRIVDEGRRLRKAVNAYLQSCRAT